MTVGPGVFKINGTHHFYGSKCLCGFDSHGRARSATEHLTQLTEAAVRKQVAEEIRGLYIEQTPGDDVGLSPAQGTYNAAIFNAARIAEGENK